MPKYRRATNETFTDQCLDLAGWEIDTCTFTNCVLELHKGERIYIRNMTADHCEFIGDGWPDSYNSRNHPRRPPKHEPEVMAKRLA